MALRQELPNGAASGVIKTIGLLMIEVACIDLSASTLIRIVDNTRSDTRK